jgi:hypothetical protein
MAIFSTVVCELEFKYGANYIEAFPFKQLVCYVHYEALDVHEQHSLRILGITQIPNLAYATTIATASQVALQATIAHHGIVPNNLDPVLISINLSLEELIATIANNPPTIDALLFASRMGEFLCVLELEFPIKSFEKNLQLTTFYQKKDKTFKMLYKKLLKLKEDSQSITDLETAHRYLRSLKGTLTLHVQVLQRIFCRIWTFVYFIRCVQHF